MRFLIGNTDQRSATATKTHSPVGDSWLAHVLFTVLVSSSSAFIKLQLQQQQHPSATGRTWSSLAARCVSTVIAAMHRALGVTRRGKPAVCYLCSYSASVCSLPDDWLPCVCVCVCVCVSFDCRCAVLGCRQRTAGVAWLQVPRQLPTPANSFCSEKSKSSPAISIAV